MRTTPVIASFLFDTEPTDPVSLAAAAVVMGLAAGVAVWIPTRRATRIGPLVARRVG